MMLVQIAPITSIGFCLNMTIKKTVIAKIIVANTGIKSTACQSASFPKKQRKFALLNYHSVENVCFTFDIDHDIKINGVKNPIKR